MTKRTFRLHDTLSRRSCWEHIKSAPDNYKVVVSPWTRSEDASAKFHSICGDLAKSGIQWFGKTRTLEQWKILLISGHTIATKSDAEIIPGLENELVSLRESSASMSISRMSSLIEYSQAWLEQHKESK